MTIDQVIDTILQADPQHDWECSEDQLTRRAVFKLDVELYIVSHYERDKHNDNFQEKWANSHPDAHAESYYFHIYYGASLVRSVILVVVDGGRALLPIPDQKSMTPKHLDFRVAEIFDHARTHEYMDRAGLNYP
jgi:hypothetical protein